MHKYYYHIVHQDGSAVNFHLIDAEAIPFASFDTAYKWFQRGSLTAGSELEILEIIKDPEVEDRYRKFLDEENTIISSGCRVKEMTI